MTATKITKITIHNNQKIDKHKHRGFALIEVMVSALVLTVGCLAFLKLQQTGMKYSFNDYARSQGVAVAQGFAEKLRGNVNLLSSTVKSGSILGGDVSLSSALPQDDTDCQSANPGTTCAEAMLEYQSYLTSKQMQSLLAGQSRLCYRIINDIANAKYGSVRLTYMWVDNTSGTTAKEDGIKEADCPSAFDSAVGSNFIDNSVTIYVQL